jgi:zinc transporter, ZIP family
MIYVVVEELIPEARHGEHSDVVTLGTMVAGFALMMMLDVALGLGV